MPSRLVTPVTSGFRHPCLNGDDDFYRWGRWEAASFQRSAISGDDDDFYHNGHEGSRSTDRGIHRLADFHR